MGSNFYTDLSERIGKAGEEMRNENKIERAIKEDILLHSVAINSRIKELIDVDKIIKFLLANKKSCENKHVTALKAGDDFKAKSYIRALDENINPLLRFWLAKKEIQSTKSKDTQNSQSEVRKIKDSHAEVKGETLPINLKADLSELPADFEQIDCSASKKEISDFFMILFKEKNKSNGKPYMEKEDVHEFVKKNFSVFKSDPTGKHFSINIKVKAALTFFIYEFYREYDYKEQKSKAKYIKLLMYNFDLYKGDSFAYISSNMSESKKPVNANTIPVYKYLTKRPGFKKR